jgi:hypothetical protein
MIAIHVNRVNSFSIVVLLFLDDFIAVLFMSFSAGNGNQVHALRILAYINRG